MTDISCTTKKSESGLLWVVEALHHFSKGSFAQSPYNLIYKQDKEAVISKALWLKDTTYKSTDFTVLNGDLTSSFQFYQIHWV